MFRRAIGPQTTRALLKFQGGITRCYTNYDHIKYPVDRQAYAAIFLYFIGIWFLFARMGSLFSVRSQFKEDYLRVWRRKLGTGYQWADAWGPQIDNFWKNVPDSVE